MNRRDSIPIIPAEQWAAALCARCVEPGHCCKGFNLTNSDGHPPTSWDDDAPPTVEDRFPFVPLYRIDQWTVEHGPDTGRTYSAWRWACPKVDAQGRCTIYEDRPQLCRDYEPLTDWLCVMTHPTL